MHLFFAPEANANSFPLPEEEAHHVKVLRMNSGTQVQVTDGKGNLYTGELEVISKKEVLVHVKQSTSFDPVTPRVIIAIAPTKMNDRTEWFLEKATELGIAEVYFLKCDRSERKEINLERFEKVVVAAMKQSLQFHKPLLHPMTSFSDFITKNSFQNSYIAWCEGDDRPLLKDQKKPGNEHVLLIGPEGDFSPTEVDLAKSGGYIPVSLGPTRLRTETAGVIGLHTLLIA